MKKYRKNTIIEVYWTDIVSDPTWQDDDKAENVEPAYCKTVGYYTMKRKGSLIISHTITNGQRDTTIIPLGCIQKVIKLKDQDPSLVHKCGDFLINQHIPK